jgi:competence protein ComEA
MKIKNWLYNTFHFNKQERNGVFVLCAILTVLVMLKIGMSFFYNNKSDIKLFTINSPTPDSTFLSTKNESITSEKKLTEHVVAKELFVFNPNTISEQDARKLGFSKKLASTLLNFRNKGGKFYKTQDLKKLYGLSSSLFDELESYILIPTTTFAKNKPFKKDSIFESNFTTKTFPEKKYTKQIIDLNSADSLQILFLKGIGPSFTKRILKYRSLLGGFHSSIQLKSIYGMTDSLFDLLSNQVTLDVANLTKIPINQIDFNSLKKHPYFNYNSAQAITNFRGKHGKLSENDIVALGVFDEQKLQLILPYLSY